MSSWVCRRYRDLCSTLVFSLENDRFRGLSFGWTLCIFRLDILHTHLRDGWVPRYVSFSSSLTSNLLQSHSGCRCTNSVHTGAARSSPRSDEKVYARRCKGNVCVILFPHRDGMESKGVPDHDFPSSNVCISTFQRSCGWQNAERTHDCTCTCLWLQPFLSSRSSQHSSHNSHIACLYTTIGRYYPILVVSIAQPECCVLLSLMTYRRVFCWRCHQYHHCCWKCPVSRQSLDRFQGWRWGKYW